MFDGHEQIIYHSKCITQQLDNCFQMDRHFSRLTLETDNLVVMETLLSSASVLFAGTTPTLALYRRIADANGLPFIR